MWQRWEGGDAGLDVGLWRRTVPPRKHGSGTATEIGCSRPEAVQSVGNLRPHYGFDNDSKPVAGTASRRGDRRSTVALPSSAPKCPLGTETTVRKSPVFSDVLPTPPRSRCPDSFPVSPLPLSVFPTFLTSHRKGKQEGLRSPWRFFPWPSAVSSLPQFGWRFPGRSGRWSV